MTISCRLLSLFFGPITEKMTSSQQQAEIWVSMALGDLSHFVVQYYTLKFRGGRIDCCIDGGKWVGTQDYSHILPTKNCCWNSLVLLTDEFFYILSTFNDFKKVSFFL